MHRVGSPLRHLLILGAIALVAGCTNFSGSNVGEPNAQTRFQFRKNLAMLRTGMPADSLELLFSPVEKPGQAGILGRSRVKTKTAERVSYTLGWRSDPKHQLGVKASDELDVTLATVLAIDKKLVSIEHHNILP